MNEKSDSGFGSVKCPICRRQLEKGFVIVGGGLWWDKEKHAWQPGEELLSRHLAKQFNTSFRGLRCSKCHIMIFNYEEKE